MTMSSNNCESMTSYFTNSYMGSDMHGHYPNGITDLDNQQMHHYSQNPNNQGNLPYPRFPPYDRMAYYNGQGMEHQGYSRPDSPSSQNGMGPQQPPPQLQNQPPNGTQLGPQTQPQAVQPQAQPVVFASCKLQAAVGGGIGMPQEGGSPPLEQIGHHINAQMPLTHHMGHQQTQVIIDISCLLILHISHLLMLHHIYFSHYTVVQRCWSSRRCT